MTAPQMRLSRIPPPLPAEATPRTPRDGTLSMHEVREYSRFLGDHLAKARSLNRCLVEHTEDAAEEERRLAAWRDRGEVPDAGYLLALIDTSVYDVENPQDASFLASVEEQVRRDAAARRASRGP
eukprot:TRINITY_DN11362_c0_g1_i1.p3 TRINITY_DN11362_c0_g1~~TRINITY_DN11362_c0_g1_i1.p3  ORF type:complete len:139 (+),score=49.31 TRINITY_DN11362_c0_g1_i1:44-418(+)